MARRPEGEKAMRSAFFVTLSLLSAVASADTIVGKVVAVADANTIVVVDSEYLRQKIRIRSIRAPQKNEPLADEVKNYLSTLLLGKRVTVYWDTWDRYGRMMGKVVTDEGDVAALLLESGMAALNPGDLAQMQPF